MKKLFSHLAPYKKELIAGPLFKLLEAILELILPIIMANVIDNYLMGTSFIVKNLILMLCIAILGLLSALVCQYYASIASQGFGTALRATLVDKILSFSANEIDRFGSSSLINRLTVDVNQLQVAVAMLIRLVVRAPFLCIGASVMAMGIDFSLSIILIVLIPVFIAVLYFILSKSIPLFTKIQSKLDRLGKMVNENLSGVRVIRAFAKKDSQRKKFSQSNDALYHISVKAGKISAIMNPATSLIMNCAICAVLYFGSVRVSGGHLTTGQLIAFISYITQIMLQMIIVANLMIMYTRAFASAKRVSEVLNTEPIIHDPETPQELKNTDLVVKFDDVSFKYPHGGYALENISFEIKAGETVGIIGGTGSGKTTILNLLLRFYDAASGSIHFFETDVKNCKLSDLRKNIAVVHQNNSLFSGTIKQNILQGNPSATDEDIIKALEISQGSEFVEELSEGIHSRLERGGKNFSGGQRQRLAIARALVSNAPVMIFDDATSALDYKTDAKLQKELKSLPKTTTKIFISQRASAVASSDKILCLDEGKLAGIGTHAQLFESCEVYRAICDSQELSKEGKFI